MSKVVGTGAFWWLAMVAMTSAQETQTSMSAAVAVELAQVLADRGLGAMAAKDTVDDDRFVAALAFPGQLLVVSARYEAPVYLVEKIARGDFREVYMDLNAASIAGTKILITDTGADGVHGDGTTVDVVATDDRTVRLDGARSGGGLSDDEYQAAAEDADRQYTRMLQALLTQAR